MMGAFSVHGRDVGGRERQLRLVGEVAVSRLSGSS